MNLPFQISIDRTRFVNRFADNIHDATKGFWSNRHNDLLAGIEGVLAANQTIGRIHGDRTYGVLSQMLRNFQNQVPLPIINCRVGHLKRVVDLRQLAVFELYVDNRADDLRDASFIHDEPFLHSACSCGQGVLI